MTVKFHELITNTKEVLQRHKTNIPLSPLQRLRARGDRAFTKRTGADTEKQKFTKCTYGGVTVGFRRVEIVSLYTPWRVGY